MSAQRYVIDNDHAVEGLHGRFDIAHLPSVHSPETLPDIFESRDDAIYVRQHGTPPLPYIALRYREQGVPGAVQHWRLIAVTSVSTRPVVGPADDERNARRKRAADLRELLRQFVHNELPVVATDRVIPTVDMAPYLAYEVQNIVEWGVPGIAYQIKRSGAPTTWAIVSLQKMRQMIAELDVPESRMRESGFSLLNSLGTFERKQQQDTQRSAYE